MNALYPRVLCVSLTQDAREIQWAAIKISVNFPQKSIIQEEMFTLAQFKAFHPLLLGSTVVGL